MRIAALGLESVLEAAEDEADIGVKCSAAWN
jgi:hypothetical protein